MASTYSTNLALELIGTGDQAGTWGNTTNTNLGTLIEQAISGYVTQAVATGTDTTLTIPNGATGVARNMYIELTGTGGTNTNLIVPANKKLYFIYNNASGAVTVKVSGQTGVSVPAGEKKILVSNGTDIVEATSYLTSVGTSLNLTTLTATSANITTLTSASATITNLLGTTLTISGNSFLATSSGNVGIGTTSPTYKLDLTSSNDGYGRQWISSVGYPSSADGSSGFQIRNLGAAVSGLKISNYANSVEWLRIDSSGNLGLGVTPNVWSTGTALQFNAAALWSLSTTDFNVLSNAYYDGGYKYKANGRSIRYFQDSSSGEFSWHNAASGTAGNAITFTQAMTLDANGRLAVGQTTILGSTNRATFANDQSTKGVISIGNSSTSGYGAIELYDNAGAQQGAMGWGNASVAVTGAASAVYMYSTGPITFLSGGTTERARVTSTGNLLVGTTTDVSGRSGVISDISGNVRAIPRTGSAKTAVYTLTVSDVGQFVELGTGGGIDVPNGVFSTGDVVSVFNNTTGNRTISLTITTAYIAGTDADKASVTLATRGVATVLFISNSVCVVNGNVS